MKSAKPICHFPLRSFLARWFSAALLLMIACPAVIAQNNQTERWLFVFDTSHQMKKYLPATITALQQMLSTSAGGQLSAGDSIGVWTFDRKLHIGQIPLITWTPSRAVVITSHLVTGLKHQRYRGKSDLGSLQPVLQHVVANSERLTVVVFCDGESHLRGTPYDNGVNKSFHIGLKEREKDRQPFVVILRSQLGKFVNCTVAYPPGSIRLPHFPPLPTPPPETNLPVATQPTPAKTHPHVSAITVPPLVIIGTNVSTNLNATATAPEQTQPAANAKTNAALQMAPSKATAHPAPATHHAPAPVSSGAPTTNPPVQAKASSETETNVSGSGATNTAPAIPPGVPSPTNAAKAFAGNPPPIQAPASITNRLSAQFTNSVAGTNSSDRQSRNLIWIGIGLLAAAVVLIVLLLLRPGRGPRGSLISRSMQDDSRGK